MLKQETISPVYYDGSTHLEFAEEITDGLELQQQEQQQIPTEHWCRFISANPFENQM